MEALGEVDRNWQTRRDDVIVVGGIGKACADARVDAKGSRVELGFQRPVAGIASIAMADCRREGSAVSLLCTSRISKN